MSHQWSSSLNASQRKLGLQIAQDVACSISNSILSRSANQVAQFAGYSTDVSALCMLLQSLHTLFPSQKFDQLAHQHLASLVHTNRVLTSVALYGGLCQIGIATHYMNTRTGRYDKLLNHIDSAVNSEAIRILEAVNHSLIDDAIRFADYDLISGLAGVGAYLLARATETTPQPALLPLLEALLDLVTPNSLGVFKMRTRNEFMQGFLKSDPRYSEGIINCGMAHGLAGVLATVALAHAAGFKSDRLSKSVSRVCEWLVSVAAIRDDFGYGWPDGIAVNGTTLCTHSSRMAMDAWCYGTPGVCRALELAGKALGDESLQNFARAAMESAISRRTRVNYHPDNAAICHGVSGLLLITLRFYQDSPSDTLKAGICNLFEELVSLYDHRHPFGFQDPQPGGHKADDAGFLTGSAGIALVLLAACSNADPAWDRALLLS